MVVDEHFLDEKNLSELRDIISKGQFAEYQKTITERSILLDMQNATPKRRRRKHRSKNTHLTPSKKKRK